MVSLPIFDRTGNQVGQYEFDLEQFAPRISKQLLHDVVVMYQANLPQGTHKTKTRGRSRVRPARCIARRARATHGPVRVALASGGGAGT